MQLLLKQGKTDTLLRLAQTLEVRAREKMSAQNKFGK